MSEPQYSFDAVHRYWTQNLATQRLTIVIPAVVWKNWPYDRLRQQWRGCGDHDAESKRLIASTIRNVAELSASRRSVPMALRTGLISRASTILSIVSVLLGCRSQTSKNPNNQSTVKARSLTLRTFARTPERLVRGSYLANGVAECFSCHGPLDFSKPGWPPVAGKEGSGYDWGLFGQVAPNITPILRLAQVHGRTICGRVRSAKVLHTMVIFSTRDAL